MSLFKNRKLKTVDVEVQGEKFILTEPSALDMCIYWDSVEEQHKLVNDDSTNMFKAQVNAKTGLMLASICLKPSMPKLNQEEIFANLCNDLTQYGDVNLFIDGAEEVAGLKMDTTDSQDGSSDTD